MSDRDDFRVGGYNINSNGPAILKPSTDWKKLNHEIPDGWEKYLLMLCEAGSAENELKLLSRFQKILRLIHDEQCLKSEVK